MNERTFEKIKKRLILVIDKVEKNRNFKDKKENEDSSVLSNEKLILENQKKLLIKANRVLEKVLIYLKNKL